MSRLSWLILIMKNTQLEKISNFVFDMSLLFVWFRFKMCKWCGVCVYEVGIKRN